MIYRINFNHADYYNLDLDLDSLADEVCESMDEDDFFEFSSKNLSLKEYWVDIGATFVNVGLKNTAPPDITVWNSSCLFLSPKAKEVLEPLLEDIGEFLPVTVDGSEYSVFNCLKVISADPDNTVDRKIGDVWQGLESLAFKNKDVEGELVFKADADRGSFVYCTESFKRILDKYELMGLDLNSDLSL